MSLPKENIDYELIPVEDRPDTWGVRYLTGDYNETVVIYDAISFNEDDEALHFKFDIKYSPDSTLSEDDVDLQKYAADILESILVEAVSNGTADLEREEI